MAKSAKTRPKRSPKHFVQGGTPSPKGKATSAGRGAREGELCFADGLDKAVGNETVKSTFALSRRLPDWIDLGFANRTGRIAEELEYAPAALPVGAFIGLARSFRAVINGITQGAPPTQIPNGALLAARRPGRADDRAEFHRPGRPPTRLGWTGEKLPR